MTEVIQKSLLELADKVLLSACTAKSQNAQSGRDHWSIEGYHYDFISYYLIFNLIFSPWKKVIVEI